MHHLVELFTNPWIIALIVMLFFGEFLPFSKKLWRKIGNSLSALGHWFLNSYENTLYKHKEDPIKDKKIHLQLNNILARLLFFSLSAIVVIFLEIFWELGFKSAQRKFERSGFALWSEKKIRQMPPWGVLALFALPFALMEFLGIFALGAFVAGQIWFGIGLYVVKVLFFIPVHFILHVGKEKLLGIAWFHRRYTIVVAILAWFKSSQTYIKVHNLLQTIKAYMQAIKQLFSRTIMLLKKAFEQSDILSPSCEKIRQEILSLEQDSKKEALYKKFFDCINTHLSESRNTHEKH